MGQRRIGQGSLAEALLPAGAGSNRWLERIAGLIDWTPMERLLAPLRAPTGRPGYPPLALFRAAMLPSGGRGPHRVVRPRCRNPVESRCSPAIQPHRLISKLFRDRLLEPDALDLVEGDLLAAAVVEAGGAW